VCCGDELGQACRRGACVLLCVHVLGVCKLRVVRCLTLLTSALCLGFVSYRNPRTREDLER
jgi:hypothetical protein